MLIEIDRQLSIIEETEAYRPRIYNRLKDEYGFVMTGFEVGQGVAQLPG